MKKMAVFLIFLTVCGFGMLAPPSLYPEDKIFGESGVSRSFLAAYAKVKRFQGQLEHYAQKHGVDLNLVLAVAMAESSGNDGEFFENEKLMVSTAGAVGLMQVMPETKKDLERGDKKNYTYMEAGVRYLKILIDKYKRLKAESGEFEIDESELKSFVVQAYNGGASRAYRDEVKNQSMFFLQRVSLYAFLIFQYQEEINEAVKKISVRILDKSYDWRKMAEELNIGVIELRLYNPLIAFYEPEIISKGRAVAFPKEKDGFSLEVRLDKEGKPKEIYYIIRPGDTFHDLANAFFRQSSDTDFSVHLKELRNKNNLLKWGPLQAGMRLNVTGSPYLQIPRGKNHER